MVMTVTNQIVEYGGVKRGRLGVIVQDLTPELANALDIELSSGALISQVLPESAAGDAGLLEGDVVIGVNGRIIDSAGSLRNVIGLSRAGENVEVEYLRDGNRFVKKVQIRAVETGISFADSTNKYLEGATLGESAGDNSRVVVLEVEPRSRVWLSGLREKDVILSINRVLIESLNDVEKVIARNSSGILLKIGRGNSVLFLVIR
jgi:S1-C subfamily serine protease